MRLGTMCPGRVHPGQMRLGTMCPGRVRPGQIRLGKMRPGRVRLVHSGASIAGASSVDAFRVGASRTCAFRQFFVGRVCLR